jgi:cell division protein FtsW
MFHSMGEQPALTGKRTTRRNRGAADTSLRSGPGIDPEIRPVSRRTYQTTAGLLDVFNKRPTSAGRFSDSNARPVAAQNVVQLRIDVPLLLTIITLLIFGLVMVYSASYDYSLRWYGSSSTIFFRQLMWMALGIAGAVCLAFINYHIWQRLALVIMGITIFLLLAVLFMNQVLNGAARTLWGGSVQPSELSKLVIVIYLSVWLYAKRDQLSDVGIGLFPLAGILGVMGGCIILQPDLSAVITICMLGGLMFFLAGGDLKQIFILLAFAILVGWAIVAVNPTGRERLSSYFVGLKDPSQGSYHIRRSFEAFVKGGWFGVGIGKGQVKLTGLPVPPTDSIFAVIGEETGVIGSILLVGLYAVFLWRGLLIARRAPDQLGSLLAGGLTLWICLEAFINMAVLVNLMPFAGNALPFISAGGSNLTMSLAAVGILMNISRLSGSKLSGQRQERTETVHAFVDLRGRNRRRSVSGGGRSSDTTGRSFRQ